MSTFIHLADRILNLAHIQYAKLETDGSLTVVGNGFEVYVEDAADAQRVRAALHACRWLPPGEPGPLGVEALWLLQDIVTGFDASRSVESLPASGRKLYERARALLARAALAEGRTPGAAATPEVMEGDAG